MVYLSYYEEYPIYEAAEGGYYYPGISLVESERLSLRQAKRKIKEFANEALAEDEGWHFDGSRKLWQSSRYIGEGCFYCIERSQGSYERGRQVYC